MSQNIWNLDGIDADLPQDNSPNKVLLKYAGQLNQESGGALKGIVTTTTIDSSPFGRTVVSNLLQQSKK